MPAPTSERRSTTTGESTPAPIKEVASPIDIDLFGFARLEVRKGNGHVSGFRMRHLWQTVIIIGNEGDALRLLDNNGRLKVTSRIGNIRKGERLESDEIGEILSSLDVVRGRGDNGSEQLVCFEGPIACVSRRPVSLIEITRHQAKRGHSPREKVVMHYK
jgi:hypothetical protein